MLGIILFPGSHPITASLPGPQEVKLCHGAAKKKINFFFVSQDKESMFEVMKMVDKANGYVYGKGEKTSLMSTAVGAEFDFFKYPLQCWARH